MPTKSLSSRTNWFVRSLASDTDVERTAEHEEVMAIQTMSRDQKWSHQEGVIAEFRMNGGTASGPLAVTPLLLLTTIGARSGRSHTKPLTYTRDGSRLVIIAAKQGSPTNPDWYHNIVADPHVTVEVGKETFRAIAHIVVGSQRQQLFDRMAAQRPNFLEFQQRTTRQLPVIVLERVLDKTTDCQSFNRDVIAEFRATGGTVGGMFEGLPVLLLTTTGAKSGKARTAPVLYASTVTDWSSPPKAAPRPTRTGTTHRGLPECHGRGDRRVVRGAGNGG